jgi:ABC-type Fe3+-hydroxamate transport system substrate-binding protein
MIALLACAPPPTTAGPRIVSLHDTTTEIVVGLGRAGDLVAATEPAFLSPEAAAAIAKVPKLGAPVSREALRALRPTAVLGTEDVAEHQPELADLPNATWIDPAGLDGLWTAVLAVGAAIGTPADAYLATLQARVPAPVSGELAVFTYDCCDPPFTMGGRAPLTELLGLLGARNVFADLDQDWTRVSWEAAIARSPSLVIVDDYEGEGDAAAKIATLAEHLPGVPTVVLPLGLALEGPRTLEAVARLRPAIEAAR